MKKMKKAPIRVNYAQTVYDAKEVRAVLKVLSNPGKIAPGEHCRLFEQQIASLFGHKYGIMVNSGSSANLIALSVLELPKGSEVITPVFTFGTTVAPIVQLGLTPVFVDVEHGSYVANIDQIEKNITPKTGAIMVPPLIGSILDMKRLRRLADKHGLFLVEDSCDTVGSTFDGKPTGTYSHISVTSFYASHIITTAGAGGMICTSNDAWAKKARVLSCWGRESTLFGTFEKSEDIKKRFAGRIDDLVYDAKFIFSEIGYNFQSTDINAAFGLEQLKKLKKFAAIRKRAFDAHYKFFSRYEKYFILPKLHERATTNWLAFPLTIKEGAPFTRADITRYLEEHNVQTRPIFTGNILRQPGYKQIRRGGEKAFPVADMIMKNGFLIGAHHGMDREQITALHSLIKEYIAGRER